MINALTVDVEEYFHPTEVQASISIDEWPNLPSRLQAQMSRILDLFAERQVKGTFFVLGWVADKHPKIVQQIADAGHEIGCHSYAHQLVYDLSPKAFREDTIRALVAIEDAAGRPIRAYRAPSYSITQRSMWALEVLVECGFTHDSSIYPIVHDRYGIPDFPRSAQTLRTPSGNICEIPIATVKLPGNRIVPVGGGGYLRLLPYAYTAAGLRRINHREAMPACVYTHPWEIDAGVPKLAAGTVSRLRTYTGLKGMESKLRNLLADFQFSTIAATYPLEKTAAPDGADTNLRSAAAVAG